MKYKKISLKLHNTIDILLHVYTNAQMLSKFASWYRTTVVVWTFKFDRKENRSRRIIYTIVHVGL